MSLTNLKKALLEGDHAGSIDETRKLIDTGTTAEKIVTGAIEPVMERLSVKCTVEQFNLLENILCGCERLLLSETAREQLNRLKGRTRLINLSDCEDFDGDCWRIVKG